MQTIEQVILAGKHDAYAQAKGGFVVAQLVDGTYDYFPHGQPPHTIQEGGRIVRGGAVVARFGYRRGQWYDDSPVED